MKKIILHLCADTGSDTQRYKMCGNAVTVNTVQAVMEGLMPCIK